MSDEPAPFAGLAFADLASADLASAGKVSGAAGLGAASDVAGFASGLAAGLDSGLAAGVGAVELCWSEAALDAGFGAAVSAAATPPANANDSTTKTGKNARKKPGKLGNSDWPKEA